MIEVANNAAVVALASQAAVISAFSRARTALCLQTFQFRWRAGLHFLLGVCAYLNGHSVAALGGDDAVVSIVVDLVVCLLYTSPSPRDKRQSRMPSSA